MKRFLALLFFATPAAADPAQTALMIAPDQMECIQETVWHDHAGEPTEVQQFYLDAHIANLLAAYAGVKAGIYTQQTVEVANAWYGCDWIQTMDLVNKVTFNQAHLTEPERGVLALPFLGD